jgi:hypothetical protein
MATTPSRPPIAPVLHRSLVTGLLILTGVMIVLKSGDMSPRLPDAGGNQVLGYTLSALSFVLTAVALVFLRARVPARREREPVEEYWASAARTILPMWFVMEAAGLTAIVSYFLTGQTVAAVAIGISIAAFIWYGPKAFANV